MPFAERGCAVAVSVQDLGKSGGGARAEPIVSGGCGAISVVPPMPTEWWLRPVSSAWRVGEHSAVVWKRLYFRPRPASFSAFGVLQGPPKALDEPKPASSIRITRMLGAPLGGRTCSIGGYFVSGSFAS